MRTGSVPQTDEPDPFAPCLLIGCVLEHLHRCAEATASASAVHRRGPCSIPACLADRGAIDLLISWALVALGAERGATLVVDLAAHQPGRVVFGLAAPLPLPFSMALLRVAVRLHNLGSHWLGVALCPGQGPGLVSALIPRHCQGIAA